MSKQSELRVVLRLIRVLRRIRKYSHVVRTLTWIGSLVAFGIWAVGEIQRHFSGISNPELDKLTAISLVVQTVTILLLLLFVEGPPPDSRTDYRSALVAAKQFAGIWTSVWVLLLIFWMMRSGMEGVTVIGGKPPTALRYAQDLLSMGAAALLLLCYLIMVLPSTGADSFRWFRVSVFLILGSIVPVALNAALVMTYDSVGETVDRFFETVEGILSGVVLALLIGRLESKFIVSPIWIVALLYGYAVLQGSYRIVVESPQGPEDRVHILLVSSVALALKILLFWHIRRIIIGGQMTEYMKSYRLMPNPKAAPVT